MVLSSDIVSHIYSFLDAEETARCASVCRGWNQISAGQLDQQNVWRDFLYKKYGRLKFEGTPPVEWRSLYIHVYRQFHPKKATKAKTKAKTSLFRKLFRRRKRKKSTATAENNFQNENIMKQLEQSRDAAKGDSQEAYAGDMLALGDFFDHLGLYSDAMDRYFMSLDIRQDVYGYNHLTIAQCFYAMGCSLLKQGSLDQALDCLVETREIQTSNLGPDAMEVGDTLNMMGLALTKRGVELYDTCTLHLDALDDALTRHWDALRIRRLHEEPVKVAETLKNLGDTHAAKDESDLAMECYKECLRIRQSELGDSHEEVANALIAVGDTGAQLGSFEEAMQSYREALAIRKYLFGDNDIRVGKLYQKIGSLEFPMSSGEYDKVSSALTAHRVNNYRPKQGTDDEARKWWLEVCDAFQELGLADSHPELSIFIGSLLPHENQRSIGVRIKQGLFGKIFVGNF